MAAFGVPMPKIGKWIVLVFLGVFLLGVSALAQKTSNSKTKAKTNNTATKKVVVLPPAPHGPLPQIPLSQLPSAPAQVDCHNGLLTIVAQNSTLADILHDVQKCTGATIDVPPNASERVVTRLGPGPARDVLAAPEPWLRALCHAVGVTFDPRMLHWEPGPRPTDGVWAPFWYRSVMRSSGFEPPRAPMPVPPEFAALQAQCEPLYRHLYAHRLTAGVGDAANL